MTWKWEYAFGAEASAKSAPPTVLAMIEAKANEIVRACAAQYPSPELHQGDDPKGKDVTLPGGVMFGYQIVIRKATVYVVQITYLSF